MTAFSEYPEYDAIGLSDLIRSGHVAPNEVLETAIELAQSVNPRLNAITIPTFERARQQLARVNKNAPLAFVPTLLKDLSIAWQGTPQTYGSRLFKDYGPDHSSEMTERYLAQGLIPIGRSAASEFGLLPVTETRAHGPTRNPWALHITSGGSSGGSAAAVAARLVPIAHATDGGGSIRIPASCCGIFGLKPTRARFPAGPASSEQWAGFATDHVITRSVRDSALLLDLTEGPESTSPYHAPALEQSCSEAIQAPPRKLKIAFTSNALLPASVHPTCKQACQEAAQLCEALGHEVEEAAPVFDSERFAHSFFLTVSGLIAAGADMSERALNRRARLDDLETETWLMRLLGESFSARDYCVARQELFAEARKVLRFFEHYDVLLTPTLALPPMRHGELRPSGLEALAQRVLARTKARTALRLEPVLKRSIKRVYEFIPFTPVANVTGQPAMSVPLSWSERGLPIGSMFTGRFGDEPTLLALAAQLEQASPWRERFAPHGVGRPDT